MGSVLLTVFFSVSGLFCSIGSLGAGKSEAEVSNVVVDTAKFKGTSNGVRIKTWQVYKENLFRTVNMACFELKIEAIFHFVKTQKSENDGSLLDAKATVFVPADFDTRT